LFEETRDGEILVVRPKVRQLTAPVTPQLKERMEKIVREGHRLVILHLGDVDFVDSTALGAIVAVRKALDARGALMLCGARDTVRAMLEVTRMDRVLRTFDDEAAAKEALLRTAS
jgi:anti-sigma B factor antagonist